LTSSSKKSEASDKENVKRARKEIKDASSLWIAWLEAELPYT
jgi:hypothetical protein